MTTASGNAGEHQAACSTFFFVRSLSASVSHGGSGGAGLVDSAVRNILEHSWRGSKERPLGGSSGGSPRKINPGFHFMSKWDQIKLAQSVFQREKQGLAAGKWPS